MDTQHEPFSLDKPLHLAGVLWRSALFLSLLLVVIYVGINWPA
jgi:hypothetical protein